MKLVLSYHGANWLLAPVASGDALRGQYIEVRAAVGGTGLKLVSDRTETAVVKTTSPDHVKKAFAVAKAHRDEGPQ